ncbi:MAG: hypothetical protein LCI00_28295 [Chloroflexi bacterium]|nr:hypothetical protein [Chloroflexota bacterium]
MTSGGFSAEFLEIVRNLAAYYVLRQQLVVLAMLDLNTRFLSEVGELDIAPYFNAFRERRRKIWEERSKTSDAEKTPEELVWKGDWKHGVHGSGCKLVNLRSGEPLEWDGPNTEEFNIDWFINHLVWRLKNELEDPYTKACKDWLESQQTDINTVKKAIYRLTETGVLKLSQSTYNCIIVKKPHIHPKLDTDIPQEVVSAALTAITDYRERQKLAIEATIELRPDFVVEVAEDPYLLPEVAYRLKALYQHLQMPLKQGPKIQTGTWNENWNYDIRYGHCTLTHLVTQEPIRWSSADPNTADYHGFTQHFYWELSKDQRDSSVQSIYQWMEDLILRSRNISISTHEHGQNYIGTAWHYLWTSLIEQNFVVLTLSEQGTLINLLKK